MWTRAPRGDSCTHTHTQTYTLLHAERSGVVSALFHTSCIRTALRNTLHATIASFLSLQFQITHHVQSILGY